MSLQLMIGWVGAVTLGIGGKPFVALPDNALGVDPALAHRVHPALFFIFFFIILLCLFLMKAMRWLDPDE